jgi:predicted nucleotidyltransferase
MPDIKPHHLDIIQSILSTHLPKTASVWLFGSRAIGNAKPYSDIDLAIDLNGEGLSLSLQSTLEHAFENSDLPYKTDIVDFNTISKEFKSIIDSTKIKIDF